MAVKLEVEEEACLHRFYKIVLSWDYLNLLKETQKTTKYTGDGSDLGLTKVKDKYKDVEEYLATFEPLLFEEVKAQIVQGRDEEDEREWKTGMIIECNETDGFHLAVVFGEDWGSVSQNDLLLLSRKKFDEGPARPNAYAFALVEHRQPNKIRLRMHLSGEIKGVNIDDVKSCSRLLNVHSLVGDRQKTCSIMKICSLSTIAREYVALRSISSLPYKDVILTAAEGNHSFEDQAWKISKSLMEFIQTNHNNSQLEAIRAGLSRKKFVLIQGPPGTGKTQTILGLLSAILHAIPARIHTKGKISEIKCGPDLHIQDKYNHWGKASPWLTGINPRDAIMPENGNDGFFPTSGNDLKPEVVNSSRKYRVRVLVCAPSNSALDEIVLLVATLKHCSSPSLWLSFSRCSVANESLITITANSLCTFPANISSITFPQSTSSKRISRKLIAIAIAITVSLLSATLIAGVAASLLYHRKNSTMATTKLQDRTVLGVRDENDRSYTPKIVRIGLKAHHSVQAVSMDYLVEQKLAGLDFQSGDKQKHGSAGRDRDTIRASIMDESAIVFSTLSFSGSSLFSKLKRNFDIVVIDEAAQAVEPATLVPLANGCKQVFLVGDPVQLPATVISPVAEKFGYSMSLFKRFQRAGYPVQMLKTQYRMHPEIRSFPSKEFYAGELEDGSDVEDRTKRLWHKYRCFGPFYFFDIYEGKESQPQGSGSWENVDEVEFVLLMYHRLVSGYPELKSSSRLAIISPYRQQVKLFRNRFRETFGLESDKVVDINTVDGFQGREKDVAIFSCVRANAERSIGFVADFRRMNVGITRARSSVLVVGSAAALRKDKHWKNLIESAEERNALFKVSKPYTEFFSDESIESMKVREALPEVVGQPPDGMEIDVPIDNAAEPDHGPPEDYGDDGGDDD